MKQLLRNISAHRVFVPAVIAGIALVLGVLLAFDLTRNILKVRGPYLLVLFVVMTFPVFAFRFFDPHEDSRPIAVYFIAGGMYYMLLGSPDFFTFFRMLIFERLPPGALVQLLLGVAALGACAGVIHFAVRLWSEIEEAPRRFLQISLPKFLAYAALHVLYLNYLSPFVRSRFGIVSI